MALRLPPVLPVVPEEHAVATGTALTRAGAVDGGLVRHRNDRAPWQSPAVRELAQAVGKSSEATPMIVEGRTGITLACVGEQRDHDVAQRAVSSSLNRGLHEKLQRAEHEKRQLQHRVATGAGPPPPANRVATFDGGQRDGSGRLVGSNAIVPSTGGPLAPTAGGREAAFGAVYEYRDSVGKPHYVSGTSMVPEVAFADDYRSHAGVRGLFEGPEASHGRAKVVWVGVGGGPVGHAEMASARDAVAQKRSARQRITELSGAKPYSRHSHMLA